ncbi:iron-containing alcohol dehydrogenase [Chryseobacterium sp. A301]
MLNFDYKNPTKILFGEGQIENLAREIPADAKVLILYGGGSIKKNGIYDQVKSALKSHEVLEFQGIPANPEYSVLLEALKVIKSNSIDYLLAVGGGSVIDGTKFLAAAACYKGEPWDLVSKRVRTHTNEALPFATVLTLPATGSEMNSGYVISRKETNEKLSSGGPGLFPTVSVLDPTVIKSLPTRQIANGIADAYTHVLEQYLTYPTDAKLQDRFSESILLTLQEVSTPLLKGPFDYKNASDFMWACTMALNGLIAKGVPTDWSVHAIGHELTAQYGIDHARTLAIIAPSHYRTMFENKKEKLAQYAERVWNITQGSLEEKAKQGIEKLEEFFHSLDIQTKLSEYTNDFQDSGEKVEKAFTDRGWLLQGERKDLTPEIARKIVENSY